MLDAVGAAQASQQAVHDLHGGKLGGHEAAGVRHDGDHSHLAQVRGLAGHVGAADDVEAAAVCMHQAPQYMLFELVVVTAEK